MIKKRKKNSLVSRKLDQVIELQKKQLENQDKLKKLELEELEEFKEEDEDIEGLEETEENILKKVEELENIEKKIRQEVVQHPLRKITYKDVGKSMVGAFVGLVSHYAVLEGVHFAETISITRASFMFFVSLMIGLIVLYYTGFRKIRDIRLLSLLPLRLIVIFSSTLFTIILVLFVIGKLDGLHYIEIYKSVAVLSMPGMIGAAVADLIGGE